MGVNSVALIEQLIYQYDQNYPFVEHHWHRDNFGGRSQGYYVEINERVNDCITWVRREASQHEIGIHAYQIVSLDQKSYDTLLVDRQPVLQGMGYDKCLQYALEHMLNVDLYSEQSLNLLPITGAARRRSYNALTAKDQQEDPSYSARYCYGPGDFSDSPREPDPLLFAFMRYS